MPQWLVSILNLLGMGAGNVVVPPPAAQVRVVDWLNFIVAQEFSLDFTTGRENRLSFPVAQTSRANFVE